MTRHTAGPSTGSDADWATHSCTQQLYVRSSKGLLVCKS